MKMYKVFIIVLALAVSAKMHAQSIFNDLLSLTIVASMHTATL